MTHPKPKKKRNAGVSTNTLDSLWSKAVKCLYPNSHEAHHIIRRAHFATRWDWKNGIGLTAERHAQAHREPLAFARWLEEHHPHMEYLREQERKLKPDFLRELGMSELEYRRAMKKELKLIIECDKIF